MLSAGLVKSLDVEVERGVDGGELVTLRRTWLETAVEHAFALPVLIVISLALILAAELLTAICNSALVEGVLGAVVEAGDGGGEVKEG